MCPYFAYARLAGIIVGGVALGFAWMAVQGWRDDSRALATVKAEAAREVAQARQAVAALKAAQERSQAASKGLQDELQKLRAARRPAPRVRLCVSPADMPAGGAGRTDSTPETDVPRPTGRDLGADLYALADDADEVAARLRACQALLR